MLDRNVLLLGGLAGVTIFLGLPVAFLRRGRRLKSVMNATAIGILLFLLVEVLIKAWAPVEEGFVAAKAGGGSFARAFVPLAIFSVGLFVGLLSLVWFEYHFLHRPMQRSGTPAEAGSVSPSTLSLMIAGGIGLHNFSEGLAIGASVASGTLGFALLLAIGFALHNATEGFGIAAPLHGTRPTWTFLLAAGTLGGAPTFLGALLGSLWTNPDLDIAFLALAGGALLYVIKELLHHTRRMENPREAFPIMAAVAFGVLLGFGTDLVLTLGGA